MKGTILICRPGETELVIRPVDGPPTVDLLKEAIGGGHIELVPYFQLILHGGRMQRCAAFCDEDGKMKELPMNNYATELWNRSLRATNGCTSDPDFLVGEVAIVFGDDEFMEAL